MNREKSSKKLTFKKSVVRNPEQSKPKTVVLLQPEISGPSGTSISKTVTDMQTTASNDMLIKDTKSKFGSPELNSALRITRAIDSVECIKPRKVKSISDLDKKKRLVVDEKAAKQVNFPYNQHIYKDLIPLCTKSEPLTLPFVSKEVVIHKDKEPILSDFFTPKVLPEYSFQVPAQSSNKTLNKQFDGFKLYRTMRNWELGF